MSELKQSICDVLFKWLLNQHLMALKSSVIYKPNLKYNAYKNESYIMKFSKMKIILKEFIIQKKKNVQKKNTK